jgi:hypothetical protein
LFSWWLSSCVSFSYSFISLEPKCYVFELFGRMSKLMMLETSRTSKKHKKGALSQGHSHSENPTLHTWGSRCQQTCWRFRGRPTRSQGVHSGGGLRPRANHTSMVEKNFSTRLHFYFCWCWYFYHGRGSYTSSAYVMNGNICWCF